MIFLKMIGRNAREISNSRAECPQIFNSIGGMPQSSPIWVGCAVMLLLCVVFVAVLRSLFDTFGALARIYAPSGLHLGALGRHMVRIGSPERLQEQF